jgi:hypothetical protein
VRGDGWVRVHLVAAEVEVLGFGEGNGLAAVECESAGGADGGDLCFDGCWVDGVGRFAEEAEEDGAVGAVADAGEGERAAAVFSRRWEAASSRVKRRAARIGPTVWELEGPMPILKSSKRLVFTT